MKHFLLIAGLLLISNTALASEDALYAPAPPADSAFVRTINATEKNEGTIKINNNALAIDDEIYSDYSVIKKGTHQISFFGMKKEILNKK